MNPNTPHTPEAVPKTASNFLEAADRTLDSRGQQYDPAGKQERSMTAVVAAFNAIYPVYAQHGMPLTVHQGWQFMTLVKMVRGATTPHIDSALDQVAYAALAAEEVASQLHKPTPPSTVDALMKQIRAGYKGCPQCGADVDKEAGSCQCGWEFEEEEPAATRVEQLLGANRALAEELGKCQHWAGVQSQELKHLEAKAMAAHEAYMQALEHNRSLEVQLDTTHSALSDFVCRFDSSKEYMTKEQVLAGQAKHEEQVAKLQARELMDIDSLNDLRRELQHLRVELADKNNLLKDVEIERNNWQNCLERAEQQFADERAAHKATDATVSRLLAKNSALCNEVRNLEVAVASVRNSLKVSEGAASQLQAKALYHQEQHNATLLELRKEKEAHQHTASALYR